MKWILFTGTWRLTDRNVEKDVRESVDTVLRRGDGIITGGATGVDFYAMEEALHADPSVLRLRVYIPAKLEHYIQDYRTNWCQTPVTMENIDALAKLLFHIRSKNPSSLIELPYEQITQEHYNIRHDHEVAAADEVFAFQVNGSPGTQDTIEKARKAGLPIALHKLYSISE